MNDKIFQMVTDKIIAILKRGVVWWLRAVRRRKQRTSFWAASRLLNREEKMELTRTEKIIGRLADIYYQRWQRTEGFGNYWLARYWEGKWRVASMMQERLLNPRI